MATASSSLLLTGSGTVLRPVAEEDAAFILERRTEGRISRHLNLTPADLGRQRRWIREQRQRADDYYFALCERDSGTLLGVIGLYNIQGNSAELGRYICVGAPGHAMEGAVLLERWGFYTLGLQTIYCVFRPENRTTRLLTRLHRWERCPAGVSDPQSGIQLEKWQLSREAFDRFLPDWQSRIQELLRVGRRRTEPTSISTR